MCYLIYGSLILTFLVFTHARLQDYALNASAGAEQWTVIALGWEMLLPLWPPLALVAAIASALTYLALRRRP
jgi:hypothetical protein